MSNKQADGTLYARCPGETWDDILEQDAKTHEVPEFLTEESLRDLGSDSINAEAYTSEDYAELERTKMWPHVWQFAAREEDIPEVGDYIIYENAGRSFLISRQDDRSVKAFYNVCLHRGRKLRTEDGNTKTFVCPFHGFTWRKTGDFLNVPCKWDFAHLDKENLGLPEVNVERCSGYIFINEDHEAEPFVEWAKPFKEHFERWKHEECQTVAWVGKVVKANWKVTSEAFLEAWHSIITHPQILGFTGDANTRYDIYGDHVNRALTPFGVLSPHLADKQLTEQDIADDFAKLSGRSGSEVIKIPDGMTARQKLAANNRKTYSEACGRDLSHISDGEFVDALLYSVFPNFAPWGGYMPNVVYRFRPYGDVDTCLMEVRILSRRKIDEPLTKSPDMVFLDADQPWSDAADFIGPTLASVYDQDMTNLPYIQEGLKSSFNKKVELGNYQEIRVRHFHQTIQKYFDKY